MAYTPIPDQELEPGKPGSSELFFKLRDNPEGIAAGSPGAPKVTNEALIDNNIAIEKMRAAAFEGVWNLDANQAFIIPKGVYGLYALTQHVVTIQILMQGSWIQVAENLAQLDGGVVTSDGVNVRLLAGTQVATVYYRKLF